MAITSTDLLQEGMVLDAPVKNAQGQVLFGIGHSLKAKHIDMMMAWGITEADVRVEEDSESAKRLEEAIRKEIERITPNFKRCDMQNDTVKETIRCVAEYRVEQKMKAAL